LAETPSLPFVEGDASTSVFYDMRVLLPSARRIPASSSSGLPMAWANNCGDFWHTIKEHCNMMPYDMEGNKERKKATYIEVTHL
jgi:hypothetical protein